MPSLRAVLITRHAISPRFATRIFLNMAFSLDFEPADPATFGCLRLAIEAGCTGFDMLKGDYAYKYRFGATGRAVRRIAIERT